ncbi:MAG: metal ABC transporter permease [Acidimicrobiia bacterium]
MNVVIAILNMPWALPWPFDSEIYQLAAIAAVATGIAAPLVGTFVVQRRMSMMGDGLGHVAIAGIGVAFAFGVSAIWVALIAAVLAALAIEWVRDRQLASGDVALAVVFYTGIALGVALASRSGGTTALNQYLFGSLVTVTPQEVVTQVVICAAISGTVVLLRRPLLAAIVDVDSARLAGVPVRFLHNVFAVLTAAIIVTSMKAIGLLLIAALIVLPVASARLLARSFGGVLRISAFIGGGCGLAGIAVARVINAAPGACVVLCASAVFILAATARGARLSRAL